MKQVDKAFQSYFKLVEKAREGKYDSNKVSPPNYLDKEGFYLLDFPNQMFQIKDNYLRIGVPKKFREEFGYEQKEIQTLFTYKEVRNKNIKRLQILPKANAKYFKYRLVYKEEKNPIETKEDTFLSIDLGVNNLATFADHSGRSAIIDGRKLKSINRWYNKEIARLRNIKDKQDIECDTKQIKKLFKNRRNKIHDYLNKTVHKIIEHCKDNRIGTVLVGNGKDWKQKVNIGDKKTKTLSRYRSTHSSRS
ncbi:IS605 OrfB-like transposable element containing RNAse H-like and Zn finger domain [Methanonatronarchaeum thermophilum]|uniref:IS605 OrfB-like transposable element containing RNAse H-like and Zn finger domain n=1 Tax=Methanonatronarchaeum thermophilum TaxID=1927129 RepID=A0A1Y3GAA5_9EURY|nr:transposase [Methanonatronarchaeum thermophilum]OUJ18381.1 IS605 OrfB-like transposable element containing RNAse H-like and Zn finger domain [Methanonatronarchaeum thermophilum]